MRAEKVEILNISLKKKAEKNGNKRKREKISIFLGLVLNTTVVYDIYILESVKIAR